MFAKDSTILKSKIKMPDNQLVWEEFKSGELVDFQDNNETRDKFHLSVTGNVFNRLIETG